MASEEHLTYIATGLPGILNERGAGNLGAALELEALEESGAADLEVKSRVDGTTTSVEPSKI